MSETVKYMVIRKFQYGEKEYKPGDEFSPSGGRWDEKIIDPDNHMVSIQRAAAKPRRGKKVKDGV